MTTMEMLKQLREESEQKISACRDLNELESVISGVMGKNGSLTAVLRTMGKLSKEERAEVGAGANQVKKALEEMIDARRQVFAQAAKLLRFQKEAVDVTAPGKALQPVGRLHPMTQTYRLIRDALVGMGFQLFGGPEIELDENNFTLLNLPKDHPARDMQDTFYLSPEFLLRTQTSAGQIHVMENQKPPIKIISPGKVFRSDDDATHSPMFSQMEGLVVDKGITLCDLQGMLDVFVKKIFGEETRTRLRPSYFPFTEPSVEVDVSCFQCGGKGCKLCKGTGWIEVLGAGVVNKKVLEGCGIDSNVYSGLAFGIGIDRIAMLKYGINNIKMLFESDLRVLDQIDD